MEFVRKWQCNLFRRLVEEAGDYAHISNMNAVEPIPIMGASLTGHVTAQSLLALEDTIKEMSAKTKPQNTP